MGNPTSIPGTGGVTAPPPGTSPQDYFQEAIFPLISGQSSPAKGCAASGCHSIVNPFSSAPGFFIVDDTSALESWKWAAVRRTSVDTSSEFANQSSERLLDKSDSLHENFANWSSDERFLIEDWSNLP